MANFKMNKKNVKDFEKYGFDNYKKFDFVIISFPTKHNLTNFLLATAIDQLKPKLIGRIPFKDLLITIVSNSEIIPPSIDFYFKKINKKNYLLVIGNYNPREIGSYKKIYDIIKKGKEIIFLNEFSRKKGSLFYLRKEFGKNELKLNLGSKFKKINNVVIKGIPHFIFEKAKKDKKNITLLFFNTNLEDIEEGFKAINSIIGDYKSKNKEIKNEEIKRIIKNNKNNEILKINYIG